jgi:hypothetical protein
VYDLQRCKLMSGQLPISLGSASHRHRLPRLQAIGVEPQPHLVGQKRWQLSRVMATVRMPSLIRCSAVVRRVSPCLTHRRFVFPTAPIASKLTSIRDFRDLY